MSSSVCLSRVVGSEVGEGSLIERRDRGVGLWSSKWYLVHWWGKEWTEAPLSLCLSDLLLASYVSRVPGI